MDSLVNDPLFFPIIPSFHSSTSSTTSAESTEEIIRQNILSMLGDFKYERKNYSIGYSVYNICTEMFPPMTSQIEFFWRRLGRQFASMLQTASFPLDTQCKFLIFVYARVLGFMGPAVAGELNSIMTIDGSPCELSWVIPKEQQPARNANRQVRFAIEPIDPRSGRPLRGSEVLDYFVSASGGLGIVVCEDGGMTWRKSTEEFLFPDNHGIEIPEGSRFFVGFDFSSKGYLTLKAYYLPAPSPLLQSPNTSNLPSNKCPINLWDVDYAPLRRLIYQLDPQLMKPLEMLLSYFEDLDENHKPRIQILAMDCVKNDKNRLKIYCRPKEGTSWSDAKRSFTLGGRLAGTVVAETLTRMEILWNNLFPAAPSSVDCDLDVAMLDDENFENENGIKLSKAQHPVGGLLYYYSLTAGSDVVFPKIYLPVTHYCQNDLFITQAIEKFYDHERVNVRNPKGGETGSGWVTREVAKAFDHRDLSERTGIHTYVTFAMKADGWELTSYFSPEVWI